MSIISKGGNIMHYENVTATVFARNVATYLDRVRYSGETVVIKKGQRVVAELVPPKPAGFPVSELANLIINAPALGASASQLKADLDQIRSESKQKLENPWD